MRQTAISAVLSVSLLLLSTPAAQAASGQAPIAASPGSRLGGLIADSCPTFSWGVVPGAESYELVVYRLAEDGHEEAAPALRQKLAGSLSSWTPSLGRCLERGGRYAWLLRAVGSEGAGDWSQPAFFRVQPRATDLEFEQALAVVRHYLAAGDGSRAGEALEEPSRVASRERSEPSSETPERLAPAATQLSVQGNVEASTFTGDGSNLAGVATDTELATHSGVIDAHHPPTVDTTCHGVACDGTNFTNLTWGNLNGVPAGLDDGDDDTTYTAGTGLELTGTELSLTPDPGPVGNRISLVDQPGGVGTRTSITLGADHLPVVSYIDTTNLHIKVAKCNDPACDPAVNGPESLSRVDAFGVLPPGSPTSITLGTDGLPVVSYYDPTNSDLKVAKCNDPACAGDDETLSTVDATDSVGIYPSITLGADGLPVVSYADWTNLALKVAKCNDPACAGGDETLSTVDAGYTVAHTSITLGADGLPVVAYQDVTNSVLRAAKCNDPACAGGDETVSIVDASTSVGSHASITLGADGLPVVSYLDGLNGELKVAKCNDPACAGGDETLSTVDDNGSVGFYTSMMLGADGLPVVSYAASGGGLKVAKCNDPACTGGDETVTTVEGGPFVGAYTSITLGADGLPVVSYLDAANGLKVAKCGTAYCSAFALEEHDHDGRYYTESELQTSGSSSVHWDNLTAVPAGLDDGDDHCDGAACDGTSFTNLAWGNLTGVPAGFDDDIDDTDDTVSWPEISGIVGTGSSQVAQGSHGHAAGDADTLDGLDSAQFLRSDADDIMSGRLEVRDSDLSFETLSVIKGTGPVPSAAAFEVMNTMTHGEAAWFKLTNTANTLPVLKLVVEGSAASDFLRCEEGANQLCRITAAGVVRTAPTDTPGVCNTNMKGGRYFDESLNELCFCNGTSWLPVDGSGSC